jgi:hypothetical protein
MSLPLAILVGFCIALSVAFLEALHRAKVFHYIAVGFRLQCWLWAVQVTDKLATWASNKLRESLDSEHNQL